MTDKADQLLAELEAGAAATMTYEQLEQLDVDMEKKSAIIASRVIQIRERWGRGYKEASKAARDDAQTIADVAFLLAHTARQNRLLKSYAVELTKAQATALQRGRDLVKLQAAKAKEVELATPEDVLRFSGKR